MRRNLAAVLLAFTSLASWAPAQSGTTFNPVGIWRVTTVSDEGAPMNVTVTIAGNPGAYAGQAVVAPDRVLPLRELATTAAGMIALFDLPQSTIVVRLVGKDGKFSGDWSEIEAMYPLTAERSK
jgi:hypothetical protein